MLLLNINGEEENQKFTKTKFKKKKSQKNTKEFKRYSINVNGKTVVVLDLPKDKIASVDVLPLLKIYKGRVLISNENKSCEELKEYLYNPKEYYQRAILSSLINQIKTVNKEWKNICIKVDRFTPFSEFFELVKISKKFNLITTNVNLQTQKFIKQCYYEYGAIIYVNKGNNIDNYAVFANLDEVDEKGKLMICVHGKNYLLYPDVSYFNDLEEYQKLREFNIEHNLICAAFSYK